MRALATAGAIPSCPQFHGYSQEPILSLGLRRRRTRRCSSGARVPSSGRATRFQVFLSQRPPDRNVSGPDTDEVFDDLLKKYGKVVYRGRDQKVPSAEVDDDSESLSFAVTLAKVANEVKAGDIRVLFVKPLVYWTRFFIIVTAFSHPQIDAIGSKIRDIAEKQFNKVASGDTKPNSWTLLDFGDVVVHIFFHSNEPFTTWKSFMATPRPLNYHLIINPHFVAETIGITSEGVKPLSKSSYPCAGQVLWFVGLLGTSYIISGR